MRRRKLLKFSLISLFTPLTGCVVAPGVDESDQNTTTGDNMANRDILVKNDYRSLTSTVSISIRRSSDQKTIFQGKFRLEPETSVFIENVLAQHGEFDVEVIENGKQSRNTKWRVPDEGDLLIDMSSEIPIRVLKRGQEGGLIGEVVDDPPLGVDITPSDDKRIRDVRPIQDILQELNEENTLATKSLSGTTFEEVQDALHMLQRYTGEEGGYYLESDGVIVVLNLEIEQ